MGIFDFFKPSDRPKTGSGTNHPRLPAKKVKVTFRDAEGNKTPKTPKKK